MRIQSAAIVTLTHAKSLHLFFSIDRLVEGNFKLITMNKDYLNLYIITTVVTGEILG